MQITIDTKHDSHQEIRKAIRMLSSLVGEAYSEPETYSEQKTPSMFDQGDDMGGMMSIFDSSPTEAEEKKENMPEMEFY
ncbi:hypothetical protein KY329_03880 [Candidatus Woesearchaeota archaeon]|nr:hypothetical protein [Candidatus Woesearchaeota archaeon]